MGLYCFSITPKIRDNPLEVIASDNTVIEELLSKLQLADISIVELGQLLIKRDDQISQQESVINRMKVALNENMFSQETIRAFENTEANLNLVSIPSQGTLQDLSNLMYFKTQFGEFYGQQVSRLCLNRNDPCLLNIPGINKHLDALETNLKPVLDHCQEFQYLLDKSSGFF